MVGGEVYFPGCKVAGAWNWPLISNHCRGQEYVDVSNHFPIHLH
jgi:hypothetical protein